MYPRITKQQAEIILCMPEDHPIGVTHGEIMKQNVERCKAGTALVDVGGVLSGWLGSPKRIVLDHPALPEELPLTTFNLWDMVADTPRESHYWCHRSLLGQRLVTVDDTNRPLLFKLTYEGIVLQRFLEGVFGQ